MGNKPKTYERTLVLLKPDTVQRALVGEIITRFEKKGLKIVAMKMVWPTAEQAGEHYYWSREEKLASGKRTIQAYISGGREMEDTDENAVEIGEQTQRKLMSLMVTGPIVAMVLEGAHAIEHVRKIRGAGNPLQADIGSITADLTIESYLLADEVDRAARNLVHASSSTDEAEREIKVWFKPEDISDYELAIEKILYSKDWEKEIK